MIERAEKRCPTCGETKPRAHWHVNRQRPDGLQAHCRDCSNARRKRRYASDPEHREYVKLYSALWYEQNRELVRERNRNLSDEQREMRWERKLRAAFGITKDDYLRMLDAQGGVCAICHQPEQRIDRRSDRIKRLAVDHCYETGRIRGLLCSFCNTAIGKLGDDPDRLRRAADYLETHNP